MKRLSLFAAVGLSALTFAHLSLAQADKEANKIAREGSEAAKEQDWDKAIERFRKAAEMDKKYNVNLSAALQQRAHAAATERRYPEAIEDYTEALKASPDDAGIYERRAAAEVKLGDMDKALADYNEAIKLKPHEVRLLNYRAYIYETKGDLQNSMADTEKVLKADKKNAEALARKTRLETRIKIQAGQQPAASMPPQKLPPPAPKSN